VQEIKYGTKTVRSDPYRRMKAANCCCCSQKVLGKHTCVRTAKKLCNECLSDGPYFLRELVGMCNACIDCVLLRIWWTLIEPPGSQYEYYRCKSSFHNVSTFEHLPEVLPDRFFVKKVLKF